MRGLSCFEEMPFVYTIMILVADPLLGSQRRVPARQASS
jgi:hypothetical protein